MNVDSDRLETPGESTDGARSRHPRRRRLLVRPEFTDPQSFDPQKEVCAQVGFVFHCSSCSAQAMRGRRLLWETTHEEEATPPTTSAH